MALVPHLTGTDYDARTEKNLHFQDYGDGKSWSEGVDEENGNYDYLMFANLDFNHPEVVKEMERWGNMGIRGIAGSGRHEAGCHQAYQ